MLIGLLSDTHIAFPSQPLPPQVLTAFKGVDLILHMGDVWIPSVLDTLESVAPVLAARGDDDYLSTLTDKRVEEKHVLKFERHTIWLIHERAYYLTSSWWKSRVPTGQEIHEIPDIVVFGHEHRTVEQRLDSILFVNPGSPTFLGYRRGLGTVGILDIDSDRADVSILHL